MRLIANQALRYASRDLAAGEAFEALSEADARVLTATGKASPAAGEAVAEEPAPPAAPATSKPGRTPPGQHGRKYARRDLRAEA